MTTNFPYYDPYAAAEPQPAEPQPADPQPAEPQPDGLPPISVQPDGRPPRKRRRMLAAGVAALAAGAVIGGVAVAESGSNTVSGSGSTAQLLPTTPGNGGVAIPGDMNRGGQGTSTSVSLATAEQQKGIVTVVSVLKYQNSESAGTGMVLTSDGEILTNNHVVNGATSITVTIASTGKSYRADVVGTDPSDDVAVLQLRNASGLTTANVGDSSGVAVGDSIVGVGNAGGTGTLRASAGSVTALNQSITATDETGQDGEKLTGLIEVKAAIIAGDSGGPLYNSAGEVIGMDTAASAHQAVNSTAYAIPIDTALQIADRIETGVETTTIHIGLPAFLGVGLDPNITRSATVQSLLAGGPAAAAGITSGSVITSVDGTTVTTADSLRTVLRSYQPGQKASISWTDSAGSSHSATVTLATGPAD
jgi:S1-C subfamily serine protease